MDRPHDWKYVDPDGDRPDRKGLLLSNQIRKFCEKGLLIAEGFKEQNLRPAAYTMRIGDKFVDSDGKPGTLDCKKSHFDMRPNSIVYVSTFEKLNLPYYIAARFNLRVKWVYKGILMGTGPQVEPGYLGYLSCPLYNFTDRPIRITYQEDFATIDFDRTTDFCKGTKASEIHDKIKCIGELDEVSIADDSFLLFRQLDFQKLKHLPGYDVLSSLFEMERDLRTWRNIGIGFAVSFFALTLTLLSFGSNVFRQTSDLSNEIKSLQTRVQASESELSKSQAEVRVLQEKMGALHGTANAGHASDADKTQTRKQSP